MAEITNLAQQLERDEGKKASAYQDELGYWTIGIGVCIDARKGCGLTEEEIVYLFQNRMRPNEAALEKTFPWTAKLDEVRRGALLNMVYEMGIAGLAKFRQFIAYLQSAIAATDPPERDRNYQAAAAAMLDSEWAREQSPARARRLAVQITTGAWQ
jgi:lysozyme